MKKAIVLLSGGLDSAVTLYIAKKDFDFQTLIFDYGQKAGEEINLAKEISKIAGCEYTVLEVSLPWKGSALLDETMGVPEGKASTGGKIPVTYVPARNMIFLSFAVSFAESIGAEAVFIGAHQLDFSNYPDCRSDFFDGFRNVIHFGTRGGREGNEVEIVTPVIDKTKQEIVEIGKQLGVPFEHTWSCYRAGTRPCGVCESCLLRAEAFDAAGIEDPAMKVAAKMD